MKNGIEIPGSATAYVYRSFNFRFEKLACLITRMALDVFVLVTFDIFHVQISSFFLFQIQLY